MCARAFTHQTHPLSSLAGLAWFAVQVVLVFGSTHIHVLAELVRNPSIVYRYLPGSGGPYTMPCLNLAPR